MDKAPQYRSFAAGSLRQGPTKMTWESVMPALEAIRRETLSEKELALLDPLISILRKIEEPAKDMVRFEQSQVRYRSQSRWGMQLSPRTMCRRWLARQ